MSYDTRAFGEFGWAFVNAGEQYRKLLDVSNDDKLEMLGLFKQATFGDCNVEATKKDERENANREAWLKFKGMDTIEAMQKYIDKVKDLASIYESKQEQQPKQQMQAQPGASKAR